MRRALALACLVLLLYAGLVGALRAADQPIRAYAVCENGKLVGVVVTATAPGNFQFGVDPDQCASTAPSPPRIERPKLMT